jgi:hypothetical protein
MLRWSLVISNGVIEIVLVKEMLLVCYGVVYFFKFDVFICFLFKFKLLYVYIASFFLVCLKKNLYRFLRRRKQITLISFFKKKKEILLILWNGPFSAEALHTQYNLYDTGDIENKWIYLIEIKVRLRYLDTTLILYLIILLFLDGGLMKL